MKEFKLSTAAERAAGVAFTAAMLTVFALLLYALRANVALLIFCALAVALVSVVLIIYVRGVMRAAAVVDGEKKLLHIRSVRDYTVDVSAATLLQTIGRKNGQTTLRVLVFSDEKEQIVATVPTMFTFRQGIWADPMAREMAAALGIAFQQNVPDWQLDKKKYEEHVKEEAQRERQEAKERRKKKMELRIKKARERK